MPLITCPNCGVKMNAGDPCPECEHWDDEDCWCATCDPLGEETEE